MTLPKDEHLQTSDLEALLAATGGDLEDVPPAVLKTLPAALRERGGEVTVTTFGRHVLAVEAGDTALHKYGLAIDIGTTSVVTTLMELESGEQLASASSLNPQAVFGGDLMSRIAFAQFDPANLRKLQTRIIGLLNQHIEQIARESGVLAKWIYKVVVVGNTCMHHLLLGIDPSYVGLAPYAPVMRHATHPPRARPLPQAAARGARVPAPDRGRLRGRGRGGGGPRDPHRRHALAPHRGGHRHEWRGPAGLARAALGVLGARRPRARGRADPPRHAGRASGPSTAWAWRTATSACTRSATLAAQGLCGSGLVDAVAVAARRWASSTGPGSSTWMAATGFPPPCARGSRCAGRSAWSCSRAPPSTGAEREIVLTQDDVRQVQLCKGAIASGVAMLRHIAGVGPERRRAS